MLSEELLNEDNWYIDSEVIEEDYRKMVEAQNNQNNVNFNTSDITNSAGIVYSPDDNNDISNSVNYVDSGMSSGATKAIIFTLIGIVLLILIVAIIYNLS